MADPINPNSMKVERILANPGADDSLSLRLVTPSGKYHEAPLTPAQKQQHRDLHNRLIHGLENASINVSSGSIMQNGRTVEPIDPNNADLKALRKLALQALEIDPDKDAFAASRWPGYHIDSLELRSPHNAPLPLFQKEPLKGMNFGKKEIERARETYGSQGRDRAEFDRLCRPALTHAKTLPKKLSKHLQAKQKELEGQATLEGVERSKKLAKLEKELTLINSAVLQFAALYPGPELTDQMTTEEITPALAAQKRIAEEVLKKFFGSPKKEAEVKKHDQLASELALLSCTTQEQYRIGCQFFKTSRKRETPELYLIRLVKALASGAGIDEAVKNLCTFSGISNAADIAALQAAITA